MRRAYLEGAEQIVFDAVRRAAMAGQECPSNDVLASLIGAASVSSPVRSLQRLQRRGKLTVKRYASSRQIIFPDGLATREPENTEPHWRDTRTAKPAAPKPRPAESNRQRQERQYAAYVERERQIEALRLPPRDPCPKCGVRGDIGCVHNPQMLEVA